MTSGKTEERITVAIRMKPMNFAGAETENSRVWRVLSKYNSITQTTKDGKPLPERVFGRNFFTFDKVYGEESTNDVIYDEIAAKIVSSVMSGVNGTIFAYGQTSSGKTYTMQGDGGGCGDSRPGTVGIIQLAARDIFQHISSDSNRSFHLRVSFIEIYNEEVRDLLLDQSCEVSAASLPVREDPLKGVFVDSVENVVSDYESLISTLLVGEKNRSVSTTAMNERSSRSHTICRITVESKKQSKMRKKVDQAKPSTSRKQHQDNDDDAVRISTLNLVDLAGSESVRHTGATGERQKEGGKINQSLLTLSRVIFALGQSDGGHVNFRDSKLTRILQPSLSGNARMAIIGCTTPSDLYLEETRSTLQFATRAKLVKTCAQVNEVQSDRAVIKELQRQLEETRASLHGKDALRKICALKAEAEKAHSVARDAQMELAQLKQSIACGEVSQMVFQRNKFDGVKQKDVDHDASGCLSNSMNKTRLTSTICEKRTTSEVVNTADSRPSLRVCTLYSPAKASLLFSVFTIILGVVLRLYSLEFEGYQGKSRLQPEGSGDLTNNKAGPVTKASLDKTSSLSEIQFTSKQDEMIKLEADRTGGFHGAEINCYPADIFLKVSAENDVLREHLDDVENSMRLLQNERDELKRLIQEQELMILSLHEGLQQKDPSSSEVTSTTSLH